MATDSKPTIAEQVLKLANGLTSKQLKQDANSIPWNPNSTEFPSRKEIPEISGAPKGAAWVWGKDDGLGRLNLLTPARVAEAAKEIRTGEMVNLDLPLNLPETPVFGREPFEHTIVTLDTNLAYDDKYNMNTQSSSQWDGFRHMSHYPTAQFYNDTRGKDIIGPEANLRNSIHYWADHGIAARGILLDYWSYAQENGISYDPYTHHAISYTALHACGLTQGIDIRPISAGGSIPPGTILLIRTGFTYHTQTVLSPLERRRLALRPNHHGPSNPCEFVGVSQDDDMLDWLHDCYFAAVAGDQPTFEVWPCKHGGPLGEASLHTHFLALWGVPLGELFDLERLASTCKRLNRWTFFFTSSPANVPGGVGSCPNAMAIF